jgi:tetratricopeptide (TPR) repeat protein
VVAAALLVAAVGVGWVLWDRAAQRAEADRQATARAAAAEADLDAAIKAAQAGDDGRAREALERAEGRLAGEGPAELRERIKRLRDDLDFAAELEEARMRATETAPGGVSVDWAGSDAAYAQAFSGRGLDVTGPGAGAARERIGRSAVKDRVVTALDAWADVRMRAKVDGWEGLLEAAGRADDSGDALRRQLREAVLRHDTGRLKELASDPGVADWPAADAVLLADALRTANDLEAAVRVLRAAQRRNPGDFWLNEKLGLILGVGDSFPPSRDEPISFQRAAVAARPRAATAHNDLGNLLYKQGKPAEAEWEYCEAIRLRPDFPTPHYNLGVLLAGLKRPEEAEKEYREALRIKPDSAKAHYNLGLLLKGLKRPEEAEKEFREAIRSKPDFPEADFNLGNLLSKQGKPVEAEKEYREALRLKPDYPDAHYGLGTLLQAQGRAVEAEKEYREAIRIKPEYPEAHFGLGVLLRKQGKVAEAEKEYREALRINPDYPEAHCNLGNLLAGQNKAAEAEQEYREAIRIKPDFPEAHLGLGNLLYGQGKPAEAEQEYREALRIKPDYPDAHYNLGNLLKDQRQPAEAEGEYSEAIRLRPDYPEAHCNLGKLLLNQGRLREALKELRRGHELGSRDPRWPYPSAEWVEVCGRLVEYDALLPAVLNGAAEPADAAAAVYFANVCQITKRHAAAARLWSMILASAGAASDPRNSIRYNAACSAALAGCGEGSDAPAGEAERARLRAQALDWLRADLAWWAKAAESGDPDARAAVKAMLSHWKEDSDLAGIRDADALAKLPEDERDAWRKLWADVEDLLAKAEAK